MAYAEMGVPPIEPRQTPAPEPAVTPGPDHPEPVSPRAHRPRRAIPIDGETTEALRLLRIAIRKAMGRRTIDQSAGLADCSTNTIARILRGENATIATAARIISRLGGQMSIAVERKRQR